MPPETAQPPALTLVASLERRLIIGIVALTVALLMLATGIISQAALNGFEREVLPEIGREATAVGQNLAAQISRAVALGVPPDKLVGVEAFFQQTLDSRPSLDRITLQLANGQVHQASRTGPRHRLTDIAIPVQSDAGPIGTLHLGLNAAVSARSAADSRWDIAIVLMVAVLTTVEILVFLTDCYVSAPLRLVERMQDRLARRDWTTREVPLGLNAIGRYLALLGAVGRLMNERRRHVLWLADEVVAEAPATRDAARRIVARLGSGAWASQRTRSSLPRDQPASQLRAHRCFYMYLPSNYRRPSSQSSRSRCMAPGCCRARSRLGCRSRRLQG